VKERECGGNIAVMYENGKMRPVETISQMGEGVRIMMEGVNLTFLRTFVNVTMSAQYTPILYIYI
jgi:hypothetical protein